MRMASSVDGVRRHGTATFLCLAWASMAGADDRAFLLEPPVFFEGSPGVVALAAPVLISDGPFVLADLDGDADLDLAAVPHADSSRDALVIVRNDRRPAVSADCDGNRILDECDIASGVASDRNANGTPDACEPGPLFHRGDADDDGRLGLSDGILVIDHVLRGHEQPSCRNRLDIADAVYLFNHLFRGGPAPPPPGPPGGPCGRDEPPAGPRGDLGCDVHSSC